MAAACWAICPPSQATPSPTTQQAQEDDGDGGLALQSAPAQSLHQGVQRVGDQAAEGEQQQGVVNGQAQPDGDGDKGEQEQRSGEYDQKTSPFFHDRLLPEWGWGYTGTPPPRWHRHRTAPGEE